MRVRELVFVRVCAFEECEKELPALVRPALGFHCMVPNTSFSGIQFVRARLSARGSQAQMNESGATLISLILVPYSRPWQPKDDSRAAIQGRRPHPIVPGEWAS